MKVLDFFLGFLAPIGAVLILVIVLAVTEETLSMRSSCGQALAAANTSEFVRSAVAEDVIRNCSAE